MDAAASSLNAVTWPTRMEPSAAPSALSVLTSGLARGDDAAWTQFHRDHGPGIFRRLLAETRGDHALASEALQLTYLKVARHARPCDSMPVFVAWLQIVTRSALNDCRRRRRTLWDLLRNKDASLDDISASTDSDRDTVLASALDTALAQLDAADRSLLELKYFTGCDVRTLAADASSERPFFREAASPRRLLQYCS